MPEERDIEPNAIAEIWDSCFLVHNVASQGASHYRYDFLGETLINAFGSDVTSQEISKDLVGAKSSPLLEVFGKVISSRKPAFEEGEFTNARGVMVKYRCSVFPLGDANKGVDYLLGGMKWKFY